MWGKAQKISTFLLKHSNQPVCCQQLKSPFFRILVLSLILSMHHDHAYMPKHTEFLPCDWLM